MATIFIGMGKPTFPIPHHFLALANELTRRGHQVHLLVHHQRPIDMREGNPAIYFWPWNQGVLRILKDLLFLIPLLRQYRPDCVIAGHRDTTVLTLAGWLVGVPVRAFYYHTLSTQIDLISRRPRWLRWFRRMLRIPVYNCVITHFIGVSEAAKRDLQAVYRAPSSKTFVLYNTLDDPLEKLSHIEKSLDIPEQRVVCVGRVDISKGQDVLIRAVAILKREFPHIRVTFIGDGRDRGQFERLAEQLGVFENCRFLGTIQYSEVLTWFRKASLSVVPSRMDNLPTTAIESMAVATPVIATSVGGIPEVLGVDGGILVPPEDPLALAENMAILLRDKTLLECWGRKARERFLRVFERSRGISRQADFFEALRAKQ